MWKLYLVWAILSSVTLLYIISKRCNVMSTIKTHTMAPAGGVSSGFACLFNFYLSNCDTSKFRRKSFYRFAFCKCFLCFFISSSSHNLQTPQKIAPLWIKLGILLLIISWHGHSLSLDVTLSSGISILNIQLQSTTTCNRVWFCYNLSWKQNW